jgi:hypothetical protein
MHFQVQTKSIEKQLHRMSEVLLPSPAETQPTRPLLVPFCAVARMDKNRVTVSEERSGICMGDFWSTMNETVIAEGMKR